MNRTNTTHDTTPAVATDDTAATAATPATPAQAQPTRDELLLADARARLASAQAAAEAARLAYDEAAHQLASGRAAQAARAAAVAEAREAAQAAATATITAPGGTGGSAATGEPSEEERRASYQQWRGEQEMARAAVAVATLETQAQAANGRLSDALHAVAVADNECRTLEMRIAASALDAEIAATVARLAELAAAARAHNEAAVKLAQQVQAHTTPNLPAVYSSQRRGAALVLPGAAPAAERARRGLDLRPAKAAGFLVSWAPDLSRPEADLSTGWMLE